MMQSLIPQPSPSLRLLVVGLNHKTAPLELRETVAFNQEQTAAALREFHARHPRAELVILSTCNRVEFYLARPLSEEPTVETLAQFIADFHKVSPSQLQGHLYHHEDRAMAEHLFAVASSLDSMVVGETQILSQVKHAYLHATHGDGGGAGKVLHVLFQRALAAAKKVHEQTRLSAGSLSIASVAVDLASSVFDRFDDKTVVCIGAGKMVSLMLRHLVDLKPKRLVITNRSLDRAQALAAEFAALGVNTQAVAFEQLDAALVEADILLTSTGATEPIVTQARFKALQKARRYRPIVMVDIAVPRDIEAGVGTLENTYLYNIDDLQEVAAGNRGKRGGEITAARQVIATHVEEFLRWYAARDVGPIVKALYEQAHAIARTELQAHLDRNPDLTPEQREELQRLSHRLIGKLLHGPVTQLTTHAEATARPMLTEAIRTLFDLKPQE